MPQVAVINASQADDAEIAFAVRAVDTQLREDFCARWNLSYMPVTFFASNENLPTASGVSLLATIVEHHDDPGTKAYHSWAGVPFIKIGRHLGVISEMLSHEVLETLADPMCIQTRKFANGLTAALEPCDPVQGWTYDIPTTIIGETRPVQVSAFVLPEWFNGFGDGPTYYCPGRTDELAPGQVADGGYLPVVSLDGVWDRIWGARADRTRVAAKDTNPTARIHRRADTWGKSQP